MKRTVTTVSFGSPDSPAPVSRTGLARLFLVGTGRLSLTGRLLLAAIILLILALATCTLAILARPTASSAAMTAQAVQTPRGTGLIGTVTGPEGRLAFPAYNSTRRNWDLYQYVIPGPAGGVPTISGGRSELIREQASQPAFSGDAQRLAFRSEDPSYLGLSVLNLTTGEVTQLTRFAEDGWPAWSIDIPGMLLFDSRRRSDRRPRIYGGLADASAEWEFAVGNKPVYGSTPCSLTGNQVLYSGCLGADCGVILAAGDASGGRVISSDRRDVAPAASPDGQWVAFMSPVSGQWKLEVVNLTGGQAGTLAPSARNQGSPVWSPDGRYVAFVSDRDGKWAIWAAAFDPAQAQVAEPVRLVELTALPPEGWPWLEQRFAWTR
jgi:hypothetical protein